MGKPTFFQKFCSYFWDITLQKYQSELSGTLIVGLENGKKVLNTTTVNYSFSSLHRVFKHAFKKSGFIHSGFKNILLLGLGGGSIVDILRTEYGLAAPITAVEIDPVVIDIAKKEFQIDRFKPIVIIQDDATSYIQRNTEKFDLVCVDLFINEKVPDQFINIRFIQPLLECLDQGGILYMNVMIISSRYEEMVDELVDRIKNLHNGQHQISTLSIEENNYMLIVKK